MLEESTYTRKEFIYIVTNPGGLLYGLTGLMVFSRALVGPVLE